MTSPRSLPLVALALAVAVLVVQARIVVGGETWDDVRYHTEIAPSRLAAAGAALSGALPGWWDGSGLGVPLLAEPSHGAAYPPIWLAATPRALDLIFVIHLLWAALGVTVWARRRATSDVGALVAGALLATTGIFASVAIRGALPALAHLPWLGWAASWLASAATRRDRARAAAVIAMLLGAVGLAGCFGVLVDAIAIAAVLGARRATAGWLAAAVVSGLAIAAFAWLPALLVAGDMAGASVAALPVSRLLELIVPGSFGGDPAHAVAAIAGTTAWAPSLFFGAPLLSLALAIRSPDRRTMRLLAVFAVMAVVVGHGDWPPWLGAPEVHLGVLAILVAVPAGAGFDAFIASERRAVLTVASAAGGLAIALLGIAAVRTSYPAAAPASAALARSLVAGLGGLACMIAAVAVAWRSRANRGATWRTPVLLALLVAPTAAAIPLVAPTIDRAVVDEPGPWARAGEQGRGSLTGTPRRMFRPALLGDSSPDLDDAIGTLAGTYAARFGIAAARSDDPARAAADDRVWLASAHEGGAMLDRFGIALAILPLAVTGGRGFTELARRGSWALARVPTAPPAAVMTSWVWIARTGDALATMFPRGGNGGLGRGRIALAGTGMAHQDGAAEPTPCALERWTDGAIDLTCEAPSDAYAVVSSSAARGWSATIDGHSTAWVTADVLRRAVALPAGRHRIHWRYTAPGIGLALGLVVAGVLGVLAMLAAAALFARRR